MQTRTLGIGLVLVFALVASGCKKKDKEKPAGKTPDKANAVKVPPATPKPKPTPPAKPAKLGNLAPGQMYALAKGELETPESVLYDATNDVYLVSNINGSPLAVDNNGFISRISPDATSKVIKWIEGGKGGVTLNAPKGMAILGDVLYVTDITVVRKFDLKTKKHLGDIAIKGATFLNDLTVGADGVYLSDTGMKAGAKGFEPSGSEAIYFIGKDDKVKKLAAGKELGKPNGLLFHGGKLWVVTFGSNELYSLSKAGKKENVVKLPKGGLDGLLAEDDKTLVITSWEAKAVFRGPPAGPFKEIVSGVEGPADIGFDSKRKRLLLPMFMGKAVQIHQL